MTKAPLEKVLTFTTEADLARYFDISPAAVNQWHINGIPANRIIGIEALVKKQVTRSEMNSALYPVEK